jgi:hypothetical protein
MPLIYRTMSIEDGKPLIANTARGLGVRLGDDPHDDMPVDADGNVHPGKGMSVAPHWKMLPLHRIPRRLRSKVPRATGNLQNTCWRMGNGPFENGVVAESLTLLVDSVSHGVVGPEVEMAADEYLLAVALTRDLWVIDEE